MKQFGKFQEPLNAGPKVVLENEHVRVLDVNIMPGGKVPMHPHPAYINVALDPCKAKLTAPNGKSHIEEYRAGDVSWREAESHEGKNIGAAKCHLLVIEMKGLAGTR